MGFFDIRRAVACLFFMLVLSTVHGQPVQPSSSDAYCPAEHLDWRLESIEDRLVDIQKIVSTLNKAPLIKDTESCIVDMASYGQDDSPKFGYVNTSGGSSEDLLVLNKLGVDRNIQIGVTTLELDPKTCTTRNRQRYDTWGSKDARGNLLESLEMKTNGAIIIGVTVDSAETDEMEFQNVVRSFFDRYNMNLSGLKIRDKFAFIIQIGSPEKTIFQRKSRYGESIRMRVALQGSTVSDVTFRRV